MILATIITTMSVSSICLIIYCNTLRASYNKKIKEGKPNFITPAKIEKKSDVGKELLVQA